MYPDDSVYVQINDDDFEVDSEGRCTLPPKMIKCPLATGLGATQGPEGPETVLAQCEAYFSFAPDFGGCSLDNKFGDDIPDCGYEIEAIQVSTS